MKGQLKIQQMAFMLMAVTLFFILVFLFYFTIKFSSLARERVEFERDKAIGLVSKIASSPELNFEGKVMSVDVDKLMVLGDVRDYDGFWGAKGIILRKLPLSEREVICTKTNYPNCNLIKVFTNANSGLAGSYVSVCRKEIFEGKQQDICEIGILMLEVDESALE